MPRGCYDRSKSASVVKSNVIPMTKQVAVTETAEAAALRINETFAVLAEMADLCIAGDIRSLIVSGDPGLGKTFLLSEKLAKADPTGQSYEMISGTIRASGLYKTLYDHRHLGCVVVLDDADSVFSDEEMLNILKKSCDSSDKRVLSWKSESNFTSDKTGEAVPKSFDFQGTVVFITNVNFDDLIDKGSKLSPHLLALQSRSFFLDVGLRSRQDKLIRIAQCIKGGMLKHLTIAQQVDVAKFINDNQANFRELSLRTVCKVGALRAKGGNWAALCRCTLLRK